LLYRVREGHREVGGRKKAGGMVCVLACSARAQAKKGQNPGRRTPFVADHKVTSLEGIRKLEGWGQREKKERLTLSSKELATSS